MDMEKILVKKGKTVVSDKKGTRLTAASLGSALAVTASDPFAAVSGMAVCILPRQTDKTSKTPDVIDQLRDLLKNMISRGARPQNLLIFLSGAAGFINESDEIALGKRLYRAVRRTLKKNGLKLKGGYVGGPLNRTASMVVGAENMVITMPDKKEIIL